MKIKLRRYLENISLDLKEKQEMQIVMLRIISERTFKWMNRYVLAS